MQGFHACLASIQDLNLGTCIEASRAVHAAGMHLLITSQFFSIAHNGLNLRHVLLSQVASIQGGLAADTTSDASYAAQAGIPLPAGYSPPPASSAAPALNPNPCLGEDPGYSTGLTTAFYGDYIGKGQFDTTSPTFERCAICVPPDRLFNLLLWHYRRTLCPEEQESGIVRRCTEEQHGSLRLHCLGSQ